MRLVVKRSYEVPPPKEKYPSPYRFTARVELSDEESRIVGQYKLEDHVLTRSQVSRTTLGNLIRGYSESESDLDLIIRNEQALRSACESLPDLFAYCRSFGEAVIFEYPS
jgi:hypothetical protein